MSLGYGRREQKKLVLCSLKELFLICKEYCPVDKIGLSLFCSLRPKYCVLSGSPGAHTMCLCINHQNFKMLLDDVEI